MILDSKKQQNIVLLLINSITFKGDFLEEIWKFRQEVLSAKIADVP